MNRFMHAGHIYLADDQTESPAVDTATSQYGAFDRLIGDFQPQVTRLVRRLMAWPDETAEVEDVVQEVFIAAWVKRDQFRGDASVGTWLTRIAINKARNYSRKKAAWRRVVDQFAQLIASEPEMTDEPPGGLATDKIAVLENKQLQAAMSRLKRSDREVIVLCYLEEMTADEIATLTGQHRNTIDSRLSRARKRLREFMGDGEK